MEKLSLETLNQFDDGSVAIAVNRALEQCYHDCRDRPHMKTKREVTIKIQLVPEPDPHQGSELDRATCTIEVHSKCPAKGVSQTVKCVPKASGFAFHADTRSVDFDPDQKSFHYPEDEE